MKKILTLCIFLMLSLVAHAAEKSVWVEINGEAYMGEIETQKEVKDRAKRDAESKAVEKAVGTFIKSQLIP